MRFIAEFELWSPFEIKNYKGLREKGSAEWLGIDIAKAFGWGKKDGLVPNNPTAERHTLEIEAFPIDKWLKFRNKLIGISHNDTPLAFEVYNALKELESHGNPNEH